MPQVLGLPSPCWPCAPLHRANTRSVGTRFTAESVDVSWKCCRVASFCCTNKLGANKVLCSLGELGGNVCSLLNHSALYCTGCPLNTIWPSMHRRLLNQCNGVKCSNRASQATGCSATAKYHKCSNLRTFLLRFYLQSFTPFCCLHCSLCITCAPSHVYVCVKMCV
jgi:hypothetical protein